MTHPSLHEHDTYKYFPVPDDDYLMRVSTVGQADHCPGRLTAEGEPSESMVFGTLVHALIAHQLREPNTTIGRGAASALSLEIESEEDIGNFEDRLGGPEKWTAWLDEAINLASGWRTWARSNLNWPIVGAIVEQQMVTRICELPTGKTLWLGGTADCILPHLGLGMDIKTTQGKGWYQGRADAQAQTHAYSWLAKAVLDVELSTFRYVVGNRTTGEWKHYDVPISMAAQGGFLARLVAVARALEADTLTYHPQGADGRRNWYCSAQWCGAWDNCPARFLGDGKDSELALPGSGWPNSIPPTT
jgi:hypothetical protein